jgi:AraC-like DNA-binding protein
MLYRRYVPPAPLASYVEHLWHLSDAPGHERERIIPNGTLELVINLQEDEIRVYDAEGGDVCRRHSGAVISGVFSTRFVIDTRQHASVLGVHFRPGGAAPFLKGLPAHALGDAHVDLGTLWGREGHQLRERACEAASVDDRFRVLERALLARLSPDPQLGRLVDATIAALDAPGCSVQGLARRFGLSHRHLIEVFGAQVGITPKLFQRIRRFQAVAALARSSSSPDWARLALLAGYSDQSHMIRDFRAFSGLTPSGYARGWSPAVKQDHLAISGR